MVEFTVVSSVVDDTNLQLLGAADLEIVTIGGEHYLFVASEADGSVTSFKLSATATPLLIDTVSYSTTSGTLAVGHLTITNVGGVLTLLPSARYDDDVATYLIDGLGNLSDPVTQPPTDISVGNFLLTHSVIVAGKTFLFAVERGVAGIASYWMQSGDSFSTKTSYTSTGIDYFDDVSAFASVTIGGQTYLFTASAMDAGINSFSVDQNGALQLIDSVDPGDGFGFSLPQALETLNVAGQDYLIMASAGTSSITVYAVGSDGSLTETDHQIDGVETRFEDASVLATFTHEGRSYILAAGSDDGLTLLELSASGTLTVIGVLADDFDTTLNNITDIEVVTIGTEIHAIISSGTENGFTQIEIDLTSTGLNIVGDQSHETLNGTSLNDTLSGMAGSDKLFAGDGDDLLIDGEGRDHFYGGAGVDVFQFVEDDTLDLIRDYEAGIDIIDLSLITGVTDIGDLTIETRSFGAIITVGSEEIRIESSDGTALTAADFSADDFIF